MRALALPTALTLALPALLALSLVSPRTASAGVCLSPRRRTTT